MPVRVVIHSSDVSKSVARSVFESTAGGRHLPQPVIAALLTLPPFSCLYRRRAGYQKAALELFTQLRAHHVLTRVREFGARGTDRFGSERHS
jgi:hypothetical protein